MNWVWKWTVHQIVLILFRSVAAYLIDCPTKKFCPLETNLSFIFFSLLID